MSIPQKIDISGKLEDDDAAMLFVSEKHQKPILNFPLDLFIATQ